MGILKSHLELLALEFSQHHIRGEVLVLGQQAVFGALNDVKNIFLAKGIKIASLPEGFDTRNKIPGWIGTPANDYTNVQSVLTLLGAQRVYVADISDYESPDYLIDFNNEISEEYREKFDVIFDIGTLEHVFDIPMALSNIVKMLKKGGELVLVLPAANAIDHGFYSFSPTLLFDYFSANGFENFSCYLIEGSSFNIAKKAKIYRYDKVGRPFPLLSDKSVEVAFFATKKTDTDNAKIIKPIQNIYANFYWDKKKYGEELIKKKPALYQDFWFI
ncbi:class I SAM-dependent methyltransferase [Candidatus Saganbacteria bacterium]|nr:class I SAM-dependent methyltransferase [Candidatus Saganbacteria bacterium]